MTNPGVVGPGEVAPRRTGGRLRLVGPQRSGPSAAHATRSPSVAVVALVAVCFMGLIFATQSARSAHPDHGDWWSDMETLHAAERLVESGFVTGKLAAPLDDGAELGVPTYLYTHWPPGSTLATAVALRAGVGPIGARALPLALSAATATLVFLWMRAVFGRGDAAFLATLWLVTASPFRLLSDSYTYQPWDLFGRALALWLIAEAVVGGGRRRSPLGVSHRLAIAVAPALSVAILGLETVPGTLLYGALLPLLFVPVGEDSTVRARLTRTAHIVGPLTAGLAVGAAIRLAQAAWVLGGLGAALRQLWSAGANRLRTSSPQFTNGYLGEWTMRMGRYLLPAVLVGGLTVLVALVRFARAAPVVRRRWLTSAWALGLPLVLAELLWPLAVRQHSHQHVHTVMHLLISTSVVCGLGCAWALRSARARLGDRALALGALLVVPFAVNWVVFPRHPYGNVSDRVEWEQTIQAMEVLHHASGSSRYVYADPSGNPDPIALYFLGRPYLRSDAPRTPELPDDPTVVHLASVPPPAPSRVLAEQAGYLVYDPGSTGASPAELLAGAQLEHAVLGILHGTALDGISFHPRRGDGPARASLAVPVGSSGTLNVHIVKLGSGGDGARMAVRFTDGDATAGHTLALHRAGEAARVSFPLPEDRPAQLSIEVDCGPVRDCDADQVGVALSLTRSP